MNLTKVDYRIQNKIAIITMNHPASLNSLDDTMMRDISSCLDAAAFDPDAKVVFIQAQGPAFSAGGDLKFISGELEKPEGEYSILEEDLTIPGFIAKQIRAIRKPVIASINGAAAGAALNIALWCDFRIASEDMIMIQAFIKVGLVTDGGGAYVLSKLIGAAKATDLVMTGRNVKADEALSLGLVNEVVPKDQLSARTLAFAEKLAAGPSSAYSYMKTLINQAAFSDMGAYLETESIFQNRAAHTKDALEGMKAFLEKRSAKFIGR